MWIAEIEEEDVDLFEGGYGNSIPTPGSSPVQTHSRPASMGAAAAAAADSPQSQAAAPHSPQLQNKAMIPIPEEKRVMVRAVEFDLRERSAVIQLGSRNLKTGTPDLKTRVTRIMW